MKNREVDVVIVDPLDKYRVRPLDVRAIGVRCGSWPRTIFRSGEKVQIGMVFRQLDAEWVYILDRFCAAPYRMASGWLSYEPLPIEEVRRRYADLRSVYGLETRLSRSPVGQSSELERKVKESGEQQRELNRDLRKRFNDLTVEKEDES